MPKRDHDKGNKVYDLTVLTGQAQSQMDAVVDEDTCKHTGTMGWTCTHIRPIHAHGKATEDQSSMTSLRSSKPAIYKLTFMKP